MDLDIQGAIRYDFLRNINSQIITTWANFSKKININFVSNLIYYEINIKICKYISLSLNFKPTKNFWNA